MWNIPIIDESLMYGLTPDYSVSLIISSLSNFVIAWSERGPNNYLLEIHTNESKITQFVINLSVAVNN